MAFRDFFKGASFLHTLARSGSAGRGLGYLLGGSTGVALGWFSFKERIAYAEQPQVERQLPTDTPPVGLNQSVVAQSIIAQQLPTTQAGKKSKRKSQEGGAK